MRLSIEFRLRRQALKQSRDAGAIFTSAASTNLNRKRKLLIATKAAMGVLALGLGVLTVAGLVQLWHVYVFAFF